MAVIDRVFHPSKRRHLLWGRERGVDAAATADLARQLVRIPAPVLQTAAELAGVRQRMEANLDVQRERRAEASGPRV